jgi:hypothetical protein
MLPLRRELNEFRLVTFTLSFRSFFKPINLKTDLFISKCQRLSIKTHFLNSSIVSSLNYAYVFFFFFDKRRDRAQYPFPSCQPWEN